MSTKILTGFRFSTPDLREIHQLIATWRKQMLRQHATAAARFCALQFLDAVDGAACGHDGETENAAGLGRSPLSAIIHGLWARQDRIKATDRRDPEVDWEFTIFLLPFENAVYGTVRTEQGAWWRLWRAQPYVDDFSYQTSTGRPARVSAAAWEERARVWKALLGDPCATPGLVGFAAACTPDLVRPEAEEVLAEVPTRTKRAMRVASRIVRERRQNDLLAEMRSNGKGEGCSTAIHAVIETGKWLTTSAGQLAMQEEAAGCVPPSGV